MSCQGGAICPFYEAVLDGEPTGHSLPRLPWSWLTSVVVAGYSFPPPPLKPELQDCGLESSQWSVCILGVSVGPYARRREVKAYCRGWSHQGLWPAFQRPLVWG